MTHGPGARFFGRAFVVGACLALGGSIPLGCKPKTAPGEAWVEPRPAPEFTGLDVRTDQTLHLGDERGSAIMLAFGYTSCADVCPATLATMHGIFAALGSAAARVTALYVSVDPERDRPPEFARFMAHFDDRIRGVYVEPAALGPLLRGYGAVAIKRPPNLRRYVGHDVDPSTDYSMDHSAGLWIIDPRGRLRVHYAYDTDPEVVARGLERLLDETPAPPTLEQARVVMHRAGVGAAYFTLKNRGARGERLLRASCPNARAVELHEVVHEGDIVRMQPAPEGFEIAAGGSLTLREGGKHLMLSGVALPPRARSARLVLEFERAGVIEVMVPVEDHTTPLPASTDPPHSEPSASPGSSAIVPASAPADTNVTIPASAPPETSASIPASAPAGAPATGPATLPTVTTPASRSVEQTRRTLFVCSDPNNLPFSNRAGKGFENQIAKLVASALGADVAYTFWPQRRGFLRMTLNAGRCDVVMGVPVGSDHVLTTKPYYRSSYVFVYGKNTPRVRSFDAPELAKLRIGVPVVGDDGANPPPMAALVRHHLIANLRGYSVYGDYRRESPPSDLIAAVRSGEVDIAIAWGPLAGYYATRSEPELAIMPVPEGPGGPETFRYDIAMAVRQDDQKLRDELDRALVVERPRIDAVLRAFAVPRL